MNNPDLLAMSLGVLKSLVREGHALTPSSMVWNKVHESIEAIEAAQAQPVGVPDGRCCAPPCKCDASNQHKCAFWMPSAASKVELPVVSDIEKLIEQLRWECYEKGYADAQAAIAAQGEKP